MALQVFRKTAKVMLERPRTPHSRSTPWRNARRALRGGGILALKALGETDVDKATRALAPPSLRVQLSEAVGCVEHDGRRGHDTAASSGPGTGTRGWRILALLDARRSLVCHLLPAVLTPLTLLRHFCLVPVDSVEPAPGALLVVEHAELLHQRNHQPLARLLALAVVGGKELRQPLACCQSCRL